MLSSRQNDIRCIGNIGKLSEEIEDEYIFWNIVVKLRLSPSEVDKWTLDEMRKANAVMDMQQDYKSAFRVLYEDRGN